MSKSWKTLFSLKVDEKKPLHTIMFTMKPTDSIFLSKEHSKVFKLQLKKPTIKMLQEFQDLNFSSLQRLRLMIKFMDLPILYKLSLLAVWMFIIFQERMQERKLLHMEHFWMNWRRYLLKSTSYQISLSQHWTNLTRRKRTEHLR